MNPPLRGKEDHARQLIEGVLDGTIDMICNCHAPHTAEEKAQGIERAPIWILVLETHSRFYHQTLWKQRNYYIRTINSFLKQKSQLIHSALEAVAWKKGVEQLILQFIDLEQEEEDWPNNILIKSEKYTIRRWNAKDGRNGQSWCVVGKNPHGKRRVR